MAFTSFFKRGKSFGNPGFIDSEFVENDELVSMENLLISFSQDFEGDLLRRYVDQAVSNESLAILAENDFGTQGANALRDFAAVLKTGGDDVEIASGITSSVVDGQASRFGYGVDAELSGKAAELSAALNEYLGESKDATLLGTSTWVSLGYLDKRIIERLGEEHSLSTTLGKPVSSFISESAQHEHASTPLGSLTLRPGDAQVLDLGAGTHVLNEDQMATLEDYLVENDGSSDTLGDIAFERMRIERPVFMMMSAFDNHYVREGVKHADRQVVLDAGTALMSTQLNNLVSRDDAVKLQSLYADPGFEAYVPHGALKLLEENLEAAISQSDRMVATYEQIVMDRQEELAEEMLVARDEYDEKRSEITSHLTEEDFEQEPDFEDEDDFVPSRARRSVPMISPSKTSPDFPSPARQRSLDRQFGM